MSNYPMQMPGKNTKTEPARWRERRKHVTRGGLVRETAYLYEDEEHALAQRAERERCSKSEVIRRALRSFLGIGE